MVVYLGLELVLGWLFIKFKDDAFEYLYLGGMSWDPLGRVEDDYLKGEVGDERRAGARRC